MNIIGRKSMLSGSVRIPGSKSHTIRALLLASLAEGASYIRNPLGGADCVSAAHAVNLLGAQADISRSDFWTVEGAGRAAHLPSDVVDVGNSGSLLYFMPPITATFDGWSIFTGDASIRRRPVLHLADALRQLGAEAHTANPGINAPPLLVKGPMRENRTVTTDGTLSQYISGMMMAAARLSGVTTIRLTDPKEAPFLEMTRSWLESIGVSVSISSGYKEITVRGIESIRSFDRTIPSDWEAAAFPLVAALITGSEIEIENIDSSGTQGDAAIVDTLKMLGADISISGSALRTKKSRLSAEHCAPQELRVNLSGYPDALCALAVAACCAEGRCIFEDIGVCRSKETDRIEVMQTNLRALGAEVESGADYLAVSGHAPYCADGTKNDAFALHGGTVDSFGDHRVAMALACLSLALPEGEALTIRDAECSRVSFPDFFAAMRTLGAAFTES